jgi:hypothetical protein
VPVEQHGKPLGIAARRRDDCGVVGGHGRPRWWVTPAIRTSRPVSSRRPGGPALRG